MRLGIVGLPNVGKSTLFNAITKAGAASANYPFCTIEPNVGVVLVPDERLNFLCNLYQPKSLVPAVVEFLDIAGLVRGASRGQGLGNQFLSHIRQVDAIVHVVRCFDDPDVVHVDGKTDPSRDIETILLELILSDLEHVQKRIDKLNKGAKSGDKKARADLDLCNRILETLENEKPVSGMTFSDEEKITLQALDLLSGKPMLYVANIAESDIGQVLSFHAQTVQAWAKKNADAFVVISAKIEEELSTLGDEERILFMDELGLKQAGLNDVICTGYQLLGLISFLTAGPQEVRAWTIRQGTCAQEAAGKIHSDFARGFIRAEVVSFEDLKTCQTMAVAKEKGLVRSEGKDYIMRDGDIVLFRFNV